MAGRCEITVEYGMRPILPLFLFLAGCAVPPAPPVADDIPVMFRVIPVGGTGGGFGEASDTVVLPASTAKILTAVAVLEEGDASRRFVTRLCRNADALVLVGGGDPALDVEDLLALALAAGDGLSGERRFLYAPAETLGPVHKDQPATAAYNPVLARLMVAEGAYRGARSEGGGAWTVPGGAPAPTEEGVDWYAHPDPPRQAADLLRSYARGLGASLPEPGPAASAHCEREVARHESDDLEGLVREMLWTSSNPMAELLGRTVLEATDPTGWLRRNHPDLPSLTVGNFSGLDPEARVTPEEMARFLAMQVDQLQGSPGMPAILTPAGWDGGLRTRFREPPLALSLWAKTGTMHYGVGLAGYLLVPEKGLHAIAFYAFDAEERAAYNAMLPNPDAAAEDRAKAWVARARQAIDRKVRETFQRLSE